MQYLRLDMYINSREYLINEAAVSFDGLEEILNSSSIIDSRIADEIRTLGVSSISPEFRTEELLDAVYELTGIDAKSDDEINFCMCLWERDEETQEDTHIDSAYIVK